ncbi:MAG: sulfotransferase [Phycisphaerales bacterium]|nr:sulfotransferase [Phycisphaerales bacterium]
MPAMSTKDAFDQARVMYDQGAYRAAYRTTNQLYSKNPHFPPIVALHVAVLLRLQRPEDGIRIAMRSLRHITNKPHRTAVLNTLSEGLTQTGNLDDAIDLLRKEIENQPGVSSLISNLGHVLLIGGKKEEAVKVAEQAQNEGQMSLSIAAVFGRAVLRTDRMQEGIELIESQLESTDNPSKAALGRAYNALGHLYDRAGRYSDAMEAFTKANDQVPAVYQDARIVSQVESIKQHWTPDQFEGFDRPATGTPRPIFIVGMPRSGTTLTEQILDAHPMCHGAGELGLISELFRQVAPDRDRPFHAGPKDYDPKRISELAKIYRRETLALADNPSVEIITDKAPMNFWYLGLITLAFPDAKIIHCTREPRDNCLSCFFQALNPGHSYSFDLRNCGLFYRHYHDVMTHYTQLLADERVGVPMFENQYESTVADQEGKTRKLLDFVGLEFDERCLNFHESGRVALTLSNDQVRQPMYATSTKRYERYAGQIDALLEGLGDIVAEQSTNN